jgi:hypothetical protein
MCQLLPVTVTNFNDDGKVMMMIVSSFFGVFFVVVFCKSVPPLLLPFREVFSQYIQYFAVIYCCYSANCLIELCLHSDILQPTVLKYQQNNN